jgi:cytochrome c-type biogenesis protein CcmH
MARLEAQHVELAQTVAVIPKSPLEKELQTSIICMCGTCGRKRIGECTCAVAAEMREEVAKLVADGRTRDQVIQYFVQKYGSQEVLSEPIDHGFNRLAWSFPYAVGLLGVLVVGGMAVRWSRTRGHAATEAEPTAPVNPELQDRLDDELRDLD